jgi:hypothetical protein
MVKFSKIEFLKNVGKLIFILFFMLIYSCKSKDDAEPDKMNNADEYYLSFRADGKEYRFTGSEIFPANFHNGINTGEGYNGNGYKTSIIATAADGRLPRMSILIYSSKSIKDTVYITNGNTTMVALDCFMPADNAQKYKIFGSNGTSEARLISIGTEGVRGTFSGTLFSYSEKLLITQGEFYLPRVN